MAAAARHGIGVTPSSAFTVGHGHAPNAVRLALASPPIERLREALLTLAQAAASGRRVVRHDGVALTVIPEVDRPRAAAIGQLRCSCMRSRPSMSARFARDHPGRDDGRAQLDADPIAPIAPHCGSLSRADGHVDMHADRVARLADEAARDRQSLRSLAGDAHANQVGAGDQPVGRVVLDPAGARQIDAAPRMRAAASRVVPEVSS